MVTKDEIEGFLDRLGADGASHSEVEPGLWIVRPSGELDFNVVVHFSPPVVLLRVKVTRAHEARVARHAQPSAARAQRDGSAPRIIRHRERLDRHDRSA